MLGLTLVLTVPAGGALRSPEGTLQPFFDAIVALLMLWFLAAGVAYGRAAGTVRSDRDVAEMVGASLATMGPYIALAFVAAQFIAYFSWSNLGTIAAVNGAESLRALGITGLPLLVGFVLLAAGLDLLIGSASAKWAIMAPVFVPMLMLLGYSPETTQAAYRVGDSVSNVLTPLMPYFPVVLAFARRWDARAGVGTLMAMMLPYALTFLVGWTVLLVAWTTLGIPLGPGAHIAYTGGAP
jgi:aminobenzoyl-glutamate transport protein